MNTPAWLAKSFSRQLALIFISSIIVRSAYAVLAPLSFDWFALYAGGVWAFQNPGSFFGVYTFPAYMFAALYVLWLHLPIMHPDAMSIVTWPQIGGVAPYFHPTPDAIAFVFIMKLPSLISDTLIGWLIYKILSNSGAGKDQILFAVSAWLLNPVTMIMSNYNGVDSVSALLTVFAVYCAAKNKLLLTSTSLIVGGLLRLLPLIVFPFSFFKSLRSRDWKGVFFLALPFAILFGTTLLAISVLNSFWLTQLFGGRPGLTVPEVLDTLGANLAQQGVEYPGNPVALTTLAYAILLWILTNPSKNGFTAESLALAPLLAYTAFSWSFAPLIMYVLPLAFIHFAVGRGQRWFTILLSVTAFLWSFARSGDYFVGSTALFYYPLYNPFLQNLSIQLLAVWNLYFGFVQVQIRGAFSAVLVFLIYRLVRRFPQNPVTNANATRYGLPPKATPPILA